jgi:hypothetical protein
MDREVLRLVVEGDAERTVARRPDRPARDRLPARC